MKQKYVDDSDYQWSETEKIKRYSKLHDEND